jgi:hypothetical protein
MRKLSPYQSILWDMVSKSTPALISAPVVRAAEQQVHAAVRPRYLNKSKKGQHPAVLPFSYGGSAHRFRSSGFSPAAGLKSSRRLG